MLRTEEHNKHPISSIDPWDGHIWHTVSMDSNIPYFLLGFSALDGPIKFGQTFLFWELEQLLHQCRQVLADKTKRLTQVSLMCPSWMTNSTGWQMVNISEIRRVQMKKNRPTVIVYVTEDGRELIASGKRIDLKHSFSDESILAISV